ncbi:GNAT family N-acetyltransferase [Brachybacterium sp. EF45031]|uniref:GNAT family N-acetyltransferase n=1 Tax=Brachybacterium sillae TaxID=2810536 RepID=UPI00217EA272|nr:GNAT family N-acetyltransferase [Brachybacterium sillae]MCS6711142.1 GNAT family N-acetyltransferase [Brachybacterium sillae]
MPPTDGVEPTDPTRASGDVPADAATDWPLRTDRLLLRGISPADAPALQRYYARADVARYLLDDPWDADRARAEAERRTGRLRLDGPPRAVNLAVEHEGTVIGDIAVWMTGRQRGEAEISWVFDPDSGGRGLATDAVAAVVTQVMDHGPVRRLVARMDARNTRSARLAARLGMVREGRHRADWWIKGEWTDTLVFALLPTDPRPRRSETERSTG